MIDRFVFGAVEVNQVMHNYSLLSKPPTILMCFVSGYFRLFEQTDSNHWTMRTLRRCRKYKRPPPFLTDNVPESVNTCKLCFTNESRVLIRPCNHAGVCNACCYKLYHLAFTEGSKPHIRLLSRNKCPFCKSIATSLMYVYFP